MYDFNGFAQFSREALSFAAGLLEHGPSLVAFCAPTTNSYRRLVPGYEAPVNLVYSQRNRSAAARIPVYSASPKAKRLEFRPGSQLQSLPRLLRADDGRPGWHPAPPGPRGA